MRSDLPERIETGARLAREASTRPPGDPIRNPKEFAAWMRARRVCEAHWNPEFVLEVVREVERLRRVEETALRVSGEYEESAFTVSLRFHDALRALDAALANPAAEECVCAEINIRHCPVHANPAAEAEA